MAQTPEDSGDDSKLELPSLSIFRRRKKDSGADESPADAPEPLAELGSEADEPDVDEAVEEPGTEETQPVQAVEPVAETSVEADVPPAVEEPEREAEPEAEAELGTMFPNAVDEADDESGEEPTQVLPTDETTTDVHEGDDYDDTDQADGEDEHVAAAVADKEPRERKELTLPAVDARIAALVTGILVGLAGVVLTFIGQRGCEAVKGTGSCGGVGLFLLIAILALMILLGAALLKAWNISDPTNSSFLAVGLVAVLAMLFFLPYIDRWYMVIVIPVLSALTYLLSWWVTHTFIETADDSAEKNADQT